MRRMKTAAALGLLALLLVIAPESRATTERDAGWASAYAPGVMEATVAWRLERGVWRNPLPAGWYQVAGYVATNDCSQVGLTATLVDPGGRAWPVLVADCGGAEPHGGAAWMTANDIVAELDWGLWERLTAAHGRPLAVELWR